MFGSTRDARHAGSQLATTATAVIVAITKAIVTVSVGACDINVGKNLARRTGFPKLLPAIAHLAAT